MRPPAVATLRAWLATLSRSSASRRLANLALRHQLAVYQQTILRPRIVGALRTLGIEVAKSTLEKYRE